MTIPLCLFSDLGARFESSPVNNDDEDRVTLSTTVSGQKKFLGIDSHGQIVLVRKA